VLIVPAEVESEAVGAAARACLKMLQSEHWSQGGRLGRQHYLSYVLAVLNEMMGRGGFVEWEDPSDLKLDRACSHRLIS
jgi:hypothetical protein